MKEQTLIEMQKKTEALIRVAQEIMNEQQKLTTLAAGTFEIVKLLPGYDDAIKAMTEKIKQDNEKVEEGGLDVG